MSDQKAILVSVRSAICTPSTLMDLVQVAAEWTDACLFLCLPDGCIAEGRPVRAREGRTLEALRRRRGVE